MRLITVVENRTMPNNFEVTYRDNADNKPSVKYVYGTEAAAAQAMDLAISSDKYIIFGSKEVLSCIPQNLRSK